jgi:hypothetical protein
MLPADGYRPDCLPSCTCQPRYVLSTLRPVGGSHFVFLFRTCVLARLTRTRGRCMDSWDGVGRWGGRLQHLVHVVIVKRATNSNMSMDATGVIHPTASSAHCVHSQLAGRRGVTWRVHDGEGGGRPAQCGDTMARGRINGGVPTKLTRPSTQLRRVRPHVPSAGPPPPCSPQHLAPPRRNIHAPT